MPLLTLSGSVCSLIGKENMLLSSKKIVYQFLVCELFTQNLRKQIFLLSEV